MSLFVLKSETLQRFSKLKEIRLEILNNKQYIIGCNDYIACVKYLGETKNDNEIVYIRFNNNLIESLRTCGFYTIETMPEFAMGSIHSDDNKDFSESIYWQDNSILDNWQKWFKTSDESKGFMYMDLYQIQCLFECSPSGEIVFPEVINSSESVIINDVNDANWLGVFIPRSDSDKMLKAAKLPEWLNADNA